MESRVCIIGIGMVESPDPVVELSHKELLFRATRKAMDDAGIERKDIGGAVTASHDFLEGRSLSNQFTLDSIGGVMKPCDMRVGEDGIYSLFAGYMEIMTDPSQVVVVASVQKASERDAEGVGFGNLIADSMEPVFARPVCRSVPTVVGLEPVLAGMEARAFMAKTGLGEEQVASVAVKNLQNAGGGRASGAEAVLKSDVLSWPIRRATKAKGADAACALILAFQERAKRAPRPAVFINGIGWCSDRSHFASREHGVARATRWAAHRAYRMAGIRRPEREIDLAEVSDWYAHRELMHCQALGFCGNQEQLSACISKRVFHRDGRLPVNVSGGLLARGNAVGTSGLIRVAQVALHLRGEAKGHQVPGAEVGVAHSWGGIPTATAGVAVLGTW